MAKDNRPPKHLRILKKGDVREDGMVFWCYKAEAKNGEVWLAREKYDGRYEKANSYGCEYSAANREDLNRKQRERYAENPEELKRKGREYTAANREEKSRSNSKYAKANPAKIAAKKSRERAMKKKALHPDHDKERLSIQILTEKSRTRSLNLGIG